MGNLENARANDVMLVVRVEIKYTSFSEIEIHQNLDCLYDNNNNNKK